MKLLDWELSDDRRVMVIRREPEEGGVLTTTVKWRRAATAVNVETALTCEPTFRQFTAHEVWTGKILRKTTRGDWFLHTISGPPTWWLPRAKFVRTVAIQAGWLRFAFTFGWLRSSGHPAISDSQEPT